MRPISAQISIYPLHQRHLGPTIVKALEAFRSRGLDVKPGTMSTVVAGELDTLLFTLHGWNVMNQLACPMA